MNHECHPLTDFNHFLTKNSVEHASSALKFCNEVLPFSSSKYPKPQDVGNVLIYNQLFALLVRNVCEVNVMAFHLK